MEGYENFRENFNKLYVPLCLDYNQTYWDASLSGKSEDWDKVSLASKKINALLSDKDSFTAIKLYRESNEVKDPILRRELEAMYLLCLGYQADPKKLDKITIMAADLEKKFNNFRTEYKGKNMHDNEVSDLLKSCTDPSELKKLWTAQRRIGRVVVDGIKEMVKLRNEVAKEIGFKNYHDMSLRLTEQDPDEVLAMYDQLDTLISGLYETQKKILDTHYAAKFKVSPEELYPWHYEDFLLRDPPCCLFKVDYNKLYKSADFCSLTSTFFASIDMDITDVLARSDLYPSPGKSQSSFCLSIDRSSNIRVLCNVQPDAWWMSNCLHEFGHALYEKHTDSSLPFLLRDCAHIFVTEGIAILFERLVYKASWIQANAGLKMTKEELHELGVVSSQYSLMARTIASTLTQIMFRFEKALYEDPDQDLDELWWTLTKKYQLIKKPPGRHEPDWACMTHIVTSPGYYHNYLLGEVLASQINHYICTKVLGTDNVLEMPYSERKEIGKYMKEKVLKSGKAKKWEEMVMDAVGEKLTPKYYVAELEQMMKMH